MSGFGDFRTKYAFTWGNAECALKRHWRWLKISTDICPVRNLNFETKSIALGKILISVSFHLILLFVHICVCVCVYLVLKFSIKCTTMEHVQLVFLESDLIGTHLETYSLYTARLTVSEEMEGKPKVPFETNGHLLVLWSAALQDKSHLNPSCIWELRVRHVSTNFQTNHLHRVLLGKFMIKGIF